jgi:hypothetical protein
MMEYWPLVILVDVSKVHGFNYRCIPCHFTLDLQCYLISKSLKHGGHEHSLFLSFLLLILIEDVMFVIALINSNEKLGVYLYALIAMLFWIFECATLPLVARHKHDDHILKLDHL